MIRIEKEIRERLREQLLIKGQSKPPIASNYDDGFCDALRWVLTASTLPNENAEPTDDVCHSDYLVRTAINEAHNNGWGPS